MSDTTAKFTLTTANRKASTPLFPSMRPAAVLPLKAEIFHVVYVIGNVTYPNGPIIHRRFIFGDRADFVRQLEDWKYRNCVVRWEIDNDPPHYLI
jgi:hypothetical protein